MVDCVEEDPLTLYVYSKKLIHSPAIWGWSATSPPTSPWGPKSERERSEILTCRGHLLSAEDINSQKLRKLSKLFHLYLHWFMFIHVAQGPFISTVADHGTRQGDVFCETEEPKKKTFAQKMHTNAHTNQKHYKKPVKTGCKVCYYLQ